MATTRSKTLTPAEKAKQEYILIRKALTGENPEKIWCYPELDCPREVPPPPPVNPD